ncbi:ABC transporter permease [Oceanibacterium hippocampi]|uniref:Glutathione transport system permease protein GsiC n=1 Tax=Oceanibacterium hippocampi TaxID=745714 RepID=A0A1Y5TU36_9PROT|nr:ABC transporter permease [Oceanibacterium hippocampi]SLN72688.1 Glutathione transport system permease protein GsiC [Oceanibacterium hippocampi]
MSSRFVIQRLVQTLLTILLLSVIVFALARLSGDPVAIMAPPEASEADLEQLRAKLGLDQPLPVQYWRFISDAVQGDFGMSIKWNTPAVDIMIDRFPATILLATTSMIFGLLLALPVGILSAVKRDTWFDNVGKVVALTGQSMPTFWFGILLILFFSLYIPIFPTSGYGTIWHLILPSITLGGFVAASIMRVTRSAMLDALEADYVRTARSKGLSEWRVILVHALRNGAIPILTIIALQAATILRGAVVTESVFAWPGVGKIAVDAVYSRDFPLVQAAVLFMGVVFLFINLLVDFMYVLLDPRISYLKK